MLQIKDKNLGTLFQNRCYRFRDKTLFQHKVEDQWQSISWEQSNQRVLKVASFLQQQGIQKGDTVAIWAENSPHWLICDLAIMTIGAVSVPIYPKVSPQHLEHILDHAACKAIFFDAALCANFEGKTKVLSKAESLQTKVALPPEAPSDSDQAVTSLFEIYEQKEVQKFPVYEALSKVAQEDLCSIIYTSGTTGTPKGVMLSHRNILSNSQMCLNAVQMASGDTALSLLPLCHVFERTAGAYTFISAGIEVCFAQSITKAIDNFSEVNPHVAFVVPRLLEKVHAAVMSKINAFPSWIASSIKKSLWLRRENKVSGSFNQFRDRMVDRILFQKIRNRFGSRLKFLVSGGAPLNPEISRDLHAMGILVLQGYGLTETSPVVSTNLPDDLRFDSVGRPVEDTQVSFGEHDEILVRGPQVMMGYYKNPEATQETMTDDGYLKTGDIGCLKNGHLHITDRLKEIIVTSGGKNIAPSPIESILSNHPLVEQVCIIGDQKKFLSALLVPNFLELEKKGLLDGETADMDFEVLNQNPKIRDLFDEILQKSNQMLSPYEQVQKYLILEREFSQDYDELTPTLKMKRRVILKNFESRVASLYRD